MPLNSTGFWAWAWNGATITPRAKIRNCKTFHRISSDFLPSDFLHS